MLQHQVMVGRLKVCQIRHVALLICRRLYYQSHHSLSLFPCPGQTFGPIGGNFRARASCHPVALILFLSRGSWASFLCLLCLLSRTLMVIIRGCTSGLVGGFGALAGCEGDGGSCCNCGSVSCCGHTHLLPLSSPCFLFNSLVGWMEGGSSSQLMWAAAAARCAGMSAQCFWRRPAFCL